jgi:hypothetical protein
LLIVYTATGAVRAGRSMVWAAGASTIPSFATTAPAEAGVVTVDVLSRKVAAGP